jgi:4-amino-4-deoxy-L-arabinose transferase-like glycosyltransferase
MAQDDHAGEASAAPMPPRRWAKMRSSFASNHPVDLVALSVILLLGAILRLLWITWLPVPPKSDFSALLRVARAIAAGHWPASSYGWAFHGVGYPLLLLPLTLVTDNLVPLRLENALFQLGMVVAVWWLTRSLFGRLPALIAALCAAIMPGIWMMATLIAKENPVFLLFPLLMILLTRLESRGRQIAVGALIALLVMIRPNFLSFLPIVGAIVAIAAFKQRTLAPLGWFGLGLAIVVVPIAGLNVINDGPPLPTAAAPWQLWEVNQEKENGGKYSLRGDWDSPFLGLPGGAGGGTARRVQAKLGFQFVVANPVAAAHNAVRRHFRQWRTDTAGYVWSYEKADRDLRNNVPFRARNIRDANDLAYVIILLLALVGAIRASNVPGVGLMVLVPVAWALLTLPLGEGNIRYHVVLSPFLCVLAGAAFRPIPRLRQSRPWAPTITGFRSIARWDGAVRAPDLRSKLVVGAGLSLILLGALSASPLEWSDAAFWDWPRTWAPGWVAIGVGIALALGVTLRQGPARFRQLSLFAHRHPGRAWASVLAVAALVLVGTAIGWSRFQAALDQLNAVAAGGWERYEVTPGAPEKSALPLILIKADLPREYRQVSYPDAVVLNYDQRSVPGTVVGLRRTLDGLRPGERYQFYLQVYDPGSTGDPNERVTIYLDGKAVWDRKGGTARKPRWDDVYLDWVARSSEVEIRVERTAGKTPVPSIAAAPAVRDLHLYPTY